MFRAYDALRAQLDENLTMLRRGSVDTLQVHESDHHPWWTDSPPEERLAFYVSTSQPHFFVLAGNIRHSVGPIHFEGFFERGQQVFH